jgi:ABC-type dipeptide/oligopeptide/nickel transport system ATPase component
MVQSHYRSHEMIIGLIGPAGAGKTTAAEMIVDILDADAEVMSVAAPIRAMLLAMGLQPADFSRKAKERHVGWIGASPRHLMQSLGDWGRGVNQSLWVSLLETRITSSLLSDSHPIIIDDVRLPLEAALIRKFNGRLIRITRPGTQGSGHQTERAQSLIEADHVIVNSQGLEHLRHALEEILQET